VSTRVVPRPPRQVTEGTLAFAVADWFGGLPWSLQDAMWIPYAGSSVLLREVGDTLTHRGNVVATRSPPAIVPGSMSADVSNARAVCAVVLRGDHYGLYPSHAKLAA